MPFQKNQDVDLEITGVTHDGDGVGHAGGMAVFVPRTARGDLTRVRLIHVKKSYAVGRLQELLRPSPCRVRPDCPVFDRCGGCTWRHIAYAEELELKRLRVQDNLRKIGGLAVEPEPTVPSPRVDGYRNKAQIPAGMEDGRLRLGFYARHSHRIVECADCRLQTPGFAGLVAACRRWAELSGIEIYNEKTGKGQLRHLYLRTAQATGRQMACVVVTRLPVPQPDLLVRLMCEAGAESVLLNRNPAATNVILGDECVTLAGPGRLIDTLCGLRFEISPLAFYQVNHDQTEQMYRAVAEMAGLTGREHVLDLYCGAGTIGLTLAGRAARLTGVEIVPQAVDDARRNAALNGIENAEFFCEDAQMAAARMVGAGEKPDLVVVDPPRKGLSAPTLDAVCRMAPVCVVYVSCDPATLARDLALFTARGYACRRVRPFDMFPRTPHVECVVLMSKVEI